ALAPEPDPKPEVAPRPDPAPAAPPPNAPARVLGAASNQPKAPKPSPPPAGRTGEQPRRLSAIVQPAVSLVPRPMPRRADHRRRLLRVHVQMPVCLGGMSSHLRPADTVS